MIFLCARMPLLPVDIENKPTVCRSHFDISLPFFKSVILFRMSNWLLSYQAKKTFAITTLLDESQLSKGENSSLLYFESPKFRWHDYRILLVRVCNLIQLQYVYIFFLLMIDFFVCRVDYLRSPSLPPPPHFHIKDNFIWRFRNIKKLLCLFFNQIDGIVT